MGNGLAIYNDTDFCITCEASISTTYHSENHVEPGQIFYYDPGAVWGTLTAYPTTSSTSLSAHRKAKRNQALMSLLTGIGDRVVKSAAKVAKLLPDSNEDKFGTLQKLKVAARMVEEQPATPQRVTSFIFNTEAMQGVDKAIAKFSGRLEHLNRVQVDPEEVKMILDTSLGLRLKEEDAEATNGNYLAIQYLRGQLEKSDLYASKTGCYGGGKGTWLKLTGGPKYNRTDASWKAGDFKFEQIKRENITDPREKMSADSRDRYNARFPSQSKFWTTIPPDAVPKDSVIVCDQSHGSSEHDNST